MNTALIQLINIIQYRLEKCLDEADEDYYEFHMGKESRSPKEILSHLVDVSNYGLSMLGATKSSAKGNSILEKVELNFKTMKAFLSETAVNKDLSKRLINGPLSDTLTHIGQLAFLRRLYGSPIAHENFSNANI